MHIFQDEEEEVRMERLADVGIEEEDEDVGNHVRKEPIPYCELHGICNIPCEGHLYVGGPLM
jgi:hypothetical protein